MDIFLRSKAYKIVAGDAAQGRLSHAYLLLCPDAASLGGYLRELAALILGSGAQGQERERIARLVAQDRYPDCRFFPAPGEKCGVAEVKELLGACYTKPVENARKVFVLGAVHEMLAAAQNKLLKALEEPPAGVVFLLGASNEYAVLSTVRSRAKKLELHSYPEAEIEAYIRAKYPACPDPAQLAALSGGLPGRADELVAGGSVAAEEEQLLRLVFDLTEEAIPVCARRYTGREEALRALSLLRLLFRDMLMLRLGREDLLLSGGDRRRLSAAAGRYSERALVRAQERIGECERGLRFNAAAAASMEALFHGILEDK